MAVSEAPCRSSIRLGLARSNNCKFYSKLINFVILCTISVQIPG